MKPDINKLKIGVIVEFEDDGIRRTITKKIPHQDMKGAYYYEFDDGVIERDVRIHGKVIKSQTEPQVCTQNQRTILQKIRCWLGLHKPSETGWGNTWEKKEYTICKYCGKKYLYKRM